MQPWMRQTKVQVFRVEMTQERMPQGLVILSHARSDSGGILYWRTTHEVVRMRKAHITWEAATKKCE
jgi:hypothetical protein